MGLSTKNKECKQKMPWKEPEQQKGYQKFVFGKYERVNECGHLLMHNQWRIPVVTF